VRLVTKVAIALGILILLLGGGTAGACKLWLDCHIHDQQGDAPPIASGKAVLPDGWSEHTVAAGFSTPTDFAFVPDGRILVTEKNGLVRLAAPDGGAPKTVLDISDRVSTYDIRGLLTITVDPAFPQKPYVYVLYTGAVPKGGMTPTTTYVSRFTWDGDKLDRESERKLLAIPQQEAHAGGQIVFAPDGTLFISTGDAAASNAAKPDPLRAQDVDELEGKVLHVTVDGKGIASNPFWNGDANANRSMVWAYGFRNPFRVTLLPGTETPVVGELGFLREDEVDVVERGGNYGWPCYEGTLRGASNVSKTATCQALYAQGANATKPALVIDEHKDGASVMGGAFVGNDGDYPAKYRDAYFYADFSYGWLRYLKLRSAGAPDAAPTAFGSALPAPVAIHVGAGGKLYYLSLTTGELRRLDYGSKS
jgi:glucose/arabinose dehydrogenase